MSVFTPDEIAFLNENRLGRLATVGADSHPHVVPTSFHADAGHGVIEIGGHDFPGRERRYRRNIRSNPNVAFVVDDLVSVDPWSPRALTLQGAAVIHQEGGERLGPGFGPIWIEITPAWISSWGIATGPYGAPNSRTV